LDVRAQPEVGYPRVSTRGQVKTGASIPYQDGEIHLILIFEAAARTCTGWMAHPTRRGRC
jgi:hypothetical protein